ncbi:hypothetical protein B0H10DRAFT_2216491 [Mycena sp. CBHHK59/15]|nr:hypothetical protein B0H10DRAFT_2216491 [Mycena sp. CBHHK59/15]
MALHERDMMERDQRDAIKIQARLDRSQNSVVPSGLTVFGTSLREATTHASTATVLGGYEHDLPIVVFRCVQELCRHGMHHHVQLGQQKLDRDRLLALISDFDSEPHFGSQTPLDCSSELREIYVLLTTYLFALPEPILSSEMFEAIWAWCVLPSLRSTDFLVDENHPRCHVPSEAGVRVAQILLRLLPLPNFSLVVYMMGFFQRLPNMGNEDVARAVFVGRSATQPQRTDGRAERAGMMMRWFLDRWDGISKALLPPPVGVHEEAHAVVQAARFRQSWTPRDSPGDFFGSSPSSLSTARAPDAEVTPRIGWSGAQPPARERAQLLRLPSDGLFERSVATSEPDSESISVSSSSALDERLLDVTLEFARDAQGDRRRWNIHGICHGSYKNLSDSVSDDSGYQEDHDDAPPSPQPPEALELSHLQAVRRISVLERELERSDVAVSEAISETFKAREQVAELKAKLRVYEEEAAKRPPVLELKLDERAADDWRAIVQCDTDVLKKQLAEVQKERDDALGILEEIRKVMRARGVELNPESKEHRCGDSRLGPQDLPITVMIPVLVFNPVVGLCTFTKKPKVVGLSHSGSSSSGPSAEMPSTARVCSSADAAVAHMLFRDGVVYFIILFVLRIANAVIAVVAPLSSIFVIVLCVDLITHTMAREGRRLPSSADDQYDAPSESPRSSSAYQSP